MQHLFDRISPSIFAPLVGRNNRRAWDLISRLAQTYFGPEATPDHPDGYLHETITKEIERFLLDNAWEDEDGTTPATPLNIQANMLLQRLVETGWLLEDRVGARRFVSMRPVVMRMFESLQQFTHEGPQLIGGNILMVHSTLKDVLQDPRGRADGFVEASRMIVRLINSLNATTMRARDLMKELTQEKDVAVFIARFFGEHLSKLYVRDFRELRTDNHPLRLRFEIIDLVSRITQEEGSRALLLEGYKARFPEEDPEALLDQHARRFDKLLDIERFLQRMDQVMDNATQRAIAYVGYRLKSTDRIEDVIQDTLVAMVAADERGLGVEGRLMAPQVVVAEERLSLPAPPVVRAVPKPVVKPEFSTRQKALLELRKAMLTRRDMNPLALRNFVRDRIPTGGTVQAEEMPINEIEDVIAFAGFLHLGIMTRAKPALMQTDPLMRKLGFRVELLDGYVDNEFFSYPNFRVVRDSADLAG